MADDTDITNMSISLPARLKSYVKARAAATGCSTPSEYMRRLIHADQQTQAKADLEQVLLARLQEPSMLLTEDDWKEIRAEVRRRIDAKQDSR